MKVNLFKLNKNKRFNYNPRYIKDKSLENMKSKKKSYTSTIVVDLPHKPGALGNISSLIGMNKGNILNVEMLERKKDYLLMPNTDSINGTDT